MNYTQPLVSLDTKVFPVCPFCKRYLGPWPSTFYGHHSHCEDVGFYAESEEAIGDAGLSYLAFTRRFPDPRAHILRRDLQIRSKRAGWIEHKLDEIDAKDNTQWDERLKARQRMIRYWECMQRGPRQGLIHDMCGDVASYLARYPKLFTVCEPGQGDYRSPPTYIPAGFPQSRHRSGAYWWLRLCKVAAEFQTGRHSWRWLVHPFFWTDEAQHFDQRARSKEKYSKERVEERLEKEGTTISDQEVANMWALHEKHESGLKHLMTLFPWLEDPANTASACKPTLHRIYTFRLNSGIALWAPVRCLKTGVERYWWAGSHQIDRHLCSGQHAWLQDVHPFYWDDNLVSYYRPLAAQPHPVMVTCRIHRDMDNSQHFSNQADMAHSIQTAYRLAEGDLEHGPMQELLRWIPWNFAQLYENPAPSSESAATGNPPDSATSTSRRAPLPDRSLMAGPSSEAGPSSGRRRR